jgi:hypothetical protein
VFYVSGRGKTAGRSRSAGTSAARGVPVRVMVVGRTRVLASAQTVRARSVVVRAGKRRCLVASATPLAALAQALRGGAHYRVRDFGHCARRTSAGSGQLFVRQIGRDANRRGDGWFYKVGGRAGTAGAADPAGPLGRGRLSAGTQLLWFYCRWDAAAHSCQRTLALETTGTPAAGAPLGVRVTGSDNEGHVRPVAGATVTIGATRAITDGDGRCVVTVPGRGTWSLKATRAGTVPAFPVRIAVG